MIVRVTAVTLKQYILIVIIATNWTGLIFRFFFEKVFNNHGWIDISHLRPVTDCVGGNDGPLNRIVSIFDKGAKTSIHGLTSNSSAKLDFIEALTAYGATIGPLNPRLKTFIV